MNEIESMIPRASPRALSGQKRRAVSHTAIENTHPFICQKKTSRCQRRNLLSVALLTLSSICEAFEARLEYKTPRWFIHSAINSAERFIDSSRLKQSNSFHLPIANGIIRHGDHVSESHGWSLPHRRKSRRGFWNGRCTAQSVHLRPENDAKESRCDLLHCI